jgi:hypothetical protein
MALYARAVCGYRGPLLLKENSASTWENVTNVMPLIDTADQIKIVSSLRDVQIATRCPQREESSAR